MAMQYKVFLWADMRWFSAINSNHFLCRGGGTIVREVFSVEMMKEFSESMIGQYNIRKEESLKKWRHGHRTGSLYRTVGAGIGAQFGIC